MCVCVCVGGGRGEGGGEAGVGTEQILKSSRTNIWTECKEIALPTDLYR